MGKDKFTILIFLWYISILSSCGQEKSKELINDINTMDEFQLIIKGSENYIQNRDLDGDGINDNILFDYSGGGHCCYKMSLYLSSLNSTIKYPFEMDGGYTFGIVNGSKPNHFEIRDYDQDGLPEIFMEISTYNGEKHAIDSNWVKNYGINTNYILFDFFERRMIVKDYIKKQ